MRFAPASLLLLLAVLLLAILLPARALAHAELATPELATSQPLPANDPPTLGLARTPWSQLPVEWCGQETSSNRTETGDASLPRIKFIYAWPTDRPNRLTQMASGLQAAASALSAFVARSSGGQKTPRFDLGTDCGAQYLDIQSLPLTKTHEAYMWGGHGSLAAVENDLQDRLDYHPAGNRIYVILADGMEGIYSGSAWVEAALQGPVGTAAIFPFNELQLGLGRRRALMPRTILHEVGHSLGAVSSDAPFSDNAAHCRQDEDLMCISSEGASNAPRVRQCPGSSDNGPVWSNLDCGGDDYFNLSPVAGSWLAQNPEANLALSPYFADCKDLPGQCEARAWKDADEDGIEDSADRCPNQAVLDTNDGCPRPTVKNCQGAHRPNGDCTELPAQSSQRQRVRLAKNKQVGYFEGLVTPNWSEYQLTARTRLTLPKGKTTVKLCVGGADTLGSPAGETLKCATRRVSLKRATTRELSVSSYAYASRSYLPERLAVSLKLTGNARYSGKLALPVALPS